MNSKEIRQLWIDFFVSKKHLFLESKSLIPYKDDSLLWINSGVATLKDYFSGKKNPPAKRLVNSQKALRTNDIENVGITSRHHTFFEMLGNFSIGDYFKNEAIEFAFEFLTQKLKLEISKLFITFYEKDLLVKEKWKSLGIKEEQLISGNKDLNFWDVGSGPCGPCTEIFYDRGEKYDSRGSELIRDDIENDRFIEIWNIVFSEYNNLGDNKYEELKQKNIDTGAGLERIASIMQNAPTNFDTDLFLPIIKEIEKKTKYKYVINNYFDKDVEQQKINMHFKIIADHIRSATNAISDGEKPSNTLRGYIIRRLIRRAYYSGKRLEIPDTTFLYTLVKIVKEILIFNIDILKVEKIIKEEEEKFSKTIETGKQILEEEMLKNKANFSPKIAFKLYETYGFPIEMTKDILKENNIFLNEDELEKLKNEHSNISKKQDAHTVLSKAINSLSLITKKEDEFTGYDQLESKSKIKFLLDSENIISQSKENELSYIIFDKTPFYATSGGQKCDEGYIIQNKNKIKILNIFKDKNNNHIHQINGMINNKDSILCFVNKELRKKSMNNHSATHLLFAALRTLYPNENIEQLGSDNSPERLTFDFPLKQKPDSSDILFLENFINNIIAQKIEREYIVTNTNEAKKMGAIMTLEESEYMDANFVRIVKFPNITSDLCGGTHVANTKDIEKFKIVSVENKGSNIWRIRAITSFKTINKYFQKQIDEQKILLKNLCNQIKDIKLVENLNNFQNIDLEKQLKNIFINIEKARIIIKNEKKSIEKMNNEISISYEIIKGGNNSVVFADNIEKEIAKKQGILLREMFPKNIIIIKSKEPNSIVIFASKNSDVTILANKFQKSWNLHGGGNKIFWQGIIKGNFNILDIKKYINE
ncbi:MAG: alanine--tRNA ligase [Metamycoplasmataceae bacterium]